MFLPDDHILFSSSEDIKKFSKPLQHLDHSVEFAYIKFFRHNKAHLKLTTWPTIQKHIYSEGYAYEGPLFYYNHLLSLGTGIYNETALIPQKYYYIKQNHLNYNANNCWVIILNEYSYHESFLFFCNNTWTSSFWQNLSLFKRFCLYFKDRAKHIIDCAEKQPIVLHRGTEPTANIELPLDQLCTQKWKINKRAFLRDTRFRHYQIESSRITLSMREFECAIAFLHGETAESTAEKLFLSRRTVETYIESLKNKFGCANKAELKKKLLENTVLQFYEDRY